MGTIAVEVLDEDLGAVWFEGDAVFPIPSVSAFTMMAERGGKKTYHPRC